MNVLAGLVVMCLSRSVGDLPAYPGAPLTRIASELTVSGEHYRVAYFTTDDGLSNVARFFFQAWTRQGLPTVTDGDLSSQAVVSAFWTREGVLQSVMLLRHRRQTLGFAVVKDLWREPPPPDDAERLDLEGVVFQQELVANEVSRPIRQSALLIQRSLAEARSSIQRALEARGFRARRVTALNARITVEHARGDVSVVTTLSRVSEDVTAVIQMFGKEGAP